MDGNKHTKGSSTLVIKEVHIKFTMRCHQIAMPKKNRAPNIASAGKNVEQLDLS